MANPLCQKGGGPSLASMKEEGRHMGDKGRVVERKGCYRMMVELRDRSVQWGGSGMQT